MKTIYFDYMSTTPIDPRVIEVMLRYMGPEGDFGNPSSRSHEYGYRAKEAVEKARAQVASSLYVDPASIIFTSGATESNNLAIKGAAHAYARQGKHLITLQTEHKAVLEPLRTLEKQGFEVTYLAPQKNGLMDVEALQQAIRSDTVLVSVMHVNNETGVIQPIDTIAKITREKGVLFHCDAAQSVGKLALNIQETPADLVSLSAHKVYGPKGVGALYVRRDPQLKLASLLQGGGHERGFRAGTLPTHQIAGMGEAFHIAQAAYQSDATKAAGYKARLLSAFEKMGGFIPTVDSALAIPQCINGRFLGVDGESFLTRLNAVALSSGSACNSASAQPSHVLLAMGLSRTDAFDAFRLSLGRFVLETDIERAITEIQRVVNELRALSPVWDRVKNSL